MRDRRGVMGKVKFSYRGGGKELSADFDRSGTPNVEPCETCMENKYNEGFKDGEPV